MGKGTLNSVYITSYATKQDGDFLKSKKYKWDETSIITDDNTFF